MTKRTVMTSGQIAQDLQPIEPARALVNIDDERGLVAARRKYPGDQEFGSWFDQSPYSEVVTNKTMRAALVYIGKHEDVAASIINSSRTVDPVAIAAAIKEAVVPVSQNVKPTAEAAPATAPPRRNSSLYACFMFSLRSFDTMTTQAIDRVGELSPKAAATMAELIIQIVEGLERLRQKLEAVVRQFE